MEDVTFHLCFQLEETTHSNNTYVRNISVRIALISRRELAKKFVKVELFLRRRALRHVRT